MSSGIKKAIEIEERQRPSGQPDDSRRLDALESLIEQSSTKGVVIGQGCFCVISVGRRQIASENSLRDALDELIDLQTEEGP